MNPALGTPIFPSMARFGSLPLSSPMTPQGIMDIVQRICRRAGIEDKALSSLRPHDLRRTFASMARDGGADIDTIKHSMGHSSVVTTERYLQQLQDFRYGRTAPDHIKVKVRKRAEKGNHGNV